MKILEFCRYITALCDSNPDMVMAFDGYESGALCVRLIDGQAVLEIEGDYKSRSIEEVLTNGTDNN